MVGRYMIPGSSSAALLVAAAGQDNRLQAPDFQVRSWRDMHRTPSTVGLSCACKLFIDRNWRMRHPHEMGDACLVAGACYVGCHTFSRLPCTQPSGCRMLQARRLYASKSPAMIATLHFIVFH